ncbi:hypothetical protein [Methanobrevibacter gottschalkii]|uniref:hypothetical protein n=1 Tax=Methanobrevibacter gottschalkii TaxID=190974 RepID=UPI0038D25762
MTNCININDPQYKNLLQLAETAGKNSVDLYLDTTRFNDFFDRFPVNIEELNNGIDFIKGSDNLSDDISKTILINSPAIERTKTNLYTFSVAEGSNRIKSLEQAYMVAKRLANEVNNKFVTTAQRPIARVLTESGAIKIAIDLNGPVINSYVQNSKIENENARLEYEDEIEAKENITEENEYDTSDYEAIQDFENLIESGEITQFCSR